MSNLDDALTILVDGREVARHAAVKPHAALTGLTELGIEVLWRYRAAWDK